MENLSLENLPLGDLPQPSEESPCLSAINQNNPQEQKKSFLAKILMESEGEFVSPARKISLLENSEILFEPYVSFSKRYEILSGSPFDKSTYEKLKGSAVNFNTYPKEYSNTPLLKKIFIIMAVIVDDYTSRTIECLLRYHLNINLVFLL